MLYLNETTLCGNIGKINAQDNHAFISLAVHKTWKDQDGKQQERNDWFNIKLFRPQLLSFAKNHLKVGQHIYIKGQLRPNEYEKDGVKHYSIDVIAERIEFVQPKPAAETEPSETSVLEGDAESDGSAPATCRPNAAA